MRMSNQRSSLDHLPVVLRIAPSNRGPKRVEVTPQAPAETTVAKSRSLSGVVAGAMLLGALGLGITLAVREPNGSPSNTPSLVKNDSAVQNDSDVKVARGPSTSNFDSSKNEDLNTILRAEYVEGARNRPQEEEPQPEVRSSSRPPKRIGKIDGVFIRRQNGDEEESR